MRPRPYVVTPGSPEDRGAVRRWLPDVERLTTEIGERVVTAWVTTWKSSRQPLLDDLPFAVEIPGYVLGEHVRDVTRVGIDLAAFAADRWGIRFDDDLLIATLLVHDVDKPLMCGVVDGRVAYVADDYLVPHGVLGARVLHDLEFPEEVVSVVATHAGNSPFHGTSRLAWLLHYADVVASDRALLDRGLTPTYDMGKTH